MKRFSEVLQKSAAWAVALMLALLPLSGLTDVQSELSIAVQWGDGQMAWASRVNYDGFGDCYWLQVPGDALDGLILDISDPSGWYTSFSPASGEVLPVPMDAGSSLSSVPVSIDVYGGDGNYAGTVYLYVSTWAAYPDSPEPAPTDEPEPTPAPVQPAQVVIHYVNENWEPVASDTVQTVEAGTWPVYAQPYDLQEYYELNDADAKDVTVDYDGAHPSEVTFIYRYNRPAPEAANVTVHYVNENGEPVASDTVQTVEAGTWPVYAQPYDLQEYYELNDADAKDVTVDYDGAHPSEVTFTYRYNRPAPEAANVTVHYVNENGEPVASDTVQTVEAGTWPVYAQPYDLQEYYELNDADAKDVTVDYDGAHPSEVTFTYRYNRPAPEAANVTVHYVNENGEPVASDTVQTVEAGTWPVYAQPYDLQEYYELNDADAKDVTVDYDGAHPSEVTFTYRYNRPAPEAANVTVHYVNENGEPVASDTVQTVEAGTWPVYAQPYDLQEYYELNDADAKDVTVDYDGAHPSEVTFTYRYNRPAPEAANVTVHYVNENGEPVASDTVQTVEAGTWPVYAQPYDLQEYYELNDADAKDVTVDYDGAHPSEVTFIYRYNRPAPEAANVTVHYVNENGEPVASDTVQTVEAGTWPVYAQPYDLQEYYELNDADAKDVTVDYDGAHPSEVTFVYAYHAPVTPEPTEEPTPEPTEEPTPEPTEEPTPEPTETPQPILPAVLPVLYHDAETGMPVASDRMVECAPGRVTVVIAAPEDLLPDYELIGEEAVEVTVDDQGQADRTEVVFYYQYIAPVTPTPEPTDAPPTEVPATPEPTDAPPTEAPATPEPTDAPPTEAPATPEPTDAPPTEAPATPEPTDAPPTEAPATPEPTDAPPTEVPAPKVALVGVRYVGPDGESFYAYTETCQEGIETTIRLDWSQVNSAWNYELASPETIVVRVDSNGIATPGEVVFQFRNEVNAYITVRYQDAATGREIALTQQVLCYVGNNIIKAAPDALEANYQLAAGEESSRPVTLTRDGVLTPSEVVFRYVYLPTPSPLPGTPTPLPFDMPMDGYGYPTGSNVNFRSSPTTEENNVIGTVHAGDLARVMGLVRNGKNEIWYAVEINGQIGYLKDSVIRLLSEAEIAALFNYTMAPGQTAVPESELIPEGTPIDRWGTTNAKVNFRRTPETINSGKNANKIGELKKNTRVWIYDAASQADGLWYRVMVNGREGYLMARYVDMMSRQESEQVQSSLTTPMATQIPPATPTPAPTEIPAPTETITPLTPPPQILDTPTPVPYRGYALTQGYGALRTGVSQTDETILEVLPEYSLVYVSGQTYVDGEAWSSVQAVASGNYGFIPHDALQPISNEVAKPYLDALQPAVIESPTPLPEQLYGYGMTVGDGVPMRAFPDTNAEILDLLPYMAVANVQGQSYENGIVWHVVQYSGQWGFIREDQLRMMSPEESYAYEQTLIESMQTPEPVIDATPEPITEFSLSSYGHVTSSSGKVNLRAEPSTQSARIRLLDNYAFALVLGSTVNEEGLWYHVSQSGTEGYIAGNYFKVLSMGELTDFLQSEEYILANTDGNSTSGNASSQIQPVEDYNQTVWQNPALSPSYEPFNPYATPTPDPERIFTPAPTEEPTPEPTAEIAPVGPTTDSTPVPATTRQGGSAWPWVLLALAAVGCGGAYYAYTIKVKNERRRQAMRAQQARQARAGAQQPQMRAAQNNPGNPGSRTSYPAQSAPFMPPQGGAPRPAVRPAAGQSAQQNTAAFQPVRPASPQTAAPGSNTVAGQETQAFRPSSVHQPAQAKPAEPGAANGSQTAAQNQETQAFRPSTVHQTAQAKPAEPAAANGSQTAAVKQDTQVFTPAAEGARAAGKTESAGQTAPQRHRRSDRHQNQSDDNA